MSELVLMVEVCRLSKISKLRTSPYHTMCNGLCEKFNGGLKEMLKAYARLSQNHGINTSPTFYCIQRGAR